VRSFLNWMKFDNEIIESATEGLSQDSVIHMTLTWLIRATNSCSSILLIIERTLATSRVGSGKLLSRATYDVEMMDVLVRVGVYRVGAEGNLGDTARSFCRVGDVNTEGDVLGSPLVIVDTLILVEETAVETLNTGDRGGGGGG
jgi:hypothetical protein